MRTYVFHFDTAQIHQGSCTALGDFLFKEEPHYAIKEVLAKNTRRDLLLSDSPWDSWEGPCSAAQLLRTQGHAFPPSRAGSERSPLRYPHLPGHLPQPPGGWFWYQASCRGGAGHMGGVLYPKDLFSSGLDWNVVLQEFDSLCKVDEDKIPSLHKGLYLKAQPRV